MTAKYILASETAIDRFVETRHADSASVLQDAVSGVHKSESDPRVTFFATGSKNFFEYSALIDVSLLAAIQSPSDVVFARISRVLKAASRPPIHLPRSWAEFHYKNRLTFFAVPENEGKERWLIEIDGPQKIARFIGLSNIRNKVNLSDWAPPDVPNVVAQYKAWADTLEPIKDAAQLERSFSEQVDLKAIGSAAVVQGYSYNIWLRRLKDDQRRIVESELDKSTRVVGPAGSGKTLTLCMRAIRIANDPKVIGERKKILIITHSWAMTERIDGVLRALAEGRIPESITVLPLLYVLQTHAGSVGSIAGAVLGEDSNEGQRRVIELINAILNEGSSNPTNQSRTKMSSIVLQGIDGSENSHARNDLVLDLYEEIIGVISAQGIMPGDSERIADYLTKERDQNLPPFATRADREFSFSIYESLLRRLVDLGAITTDQLVQDCIRVFETYTWNVRRETDGYDYILIDELQLFDSQERLAVSLLSRSKSGMKFLSVEDPSQGVFSTLNAISKAMGISTQVYLNETHRFRAGLFEFISFLYGQFALNAQPINVSLSESGVRKPRLVQVANIKEIAAYCVDKVREVSRSSDKTRRICIVCINEVEAEIYKAIEHEGALPVVLLSSFDDVEKLTYQHRAAVVSPWQFVGGAQFSDVVLVMTGMKAPNNPHAKLRELTAIYLGASRASSGLDIVSDSRVPEVIQRAVDSKLITKARDSTAK